MMNNEEITENNCETHEIDIPSSSDTNVAVSNDQSGPEYFQFQCALCSLDVRARFGDLKIGKLEYPGEVYYTRSPFREYDRTKKVTLRDYVVCGSKCSMCFRDVCVKIQCSFYYEKNYCITCIMQNRANFPDKVIEHIISRNNKYQRTKQ
jgi:hypothetical protein